MMAALHQRGIIMRASLFMAAALVAAPLLGAAALAAGTIPAPIAAAVADTARPAADTDRDAVRKPAEMLALAGVKPGKQVAELWPGGGYFTRVLSVTVGAKGHVYLLPPPPRPRPASSAPAMSSMPGGMPAMSAAMPPSPLQALAEDLHYGNISLLAWSALTSDPPTVPKVDLVWTSDNYHDFHNMPNADLAALNKHVFDVLKPGGVYMIIDHAAAAGHGASDTRTLHRIDPETVKSEVEGVGFKLAATSDALHNADDPHTAPIFDGSIRGHTDQFVLKFVKP
jgi:predicted methyltransferase